MRRRFARCVQRLHVERLESRDMLAAPGVLRLGVLAPAQTVLSGRFTDGREVDVARMTQTGGWQVGAGSGQAFAMNGWGNWGARSGWRSFLVADFNGDGRDDIAGLKARGSWQVGLSSGDFFSTRQWGYWGSVGRWSKFVSGDFNGDGKSDLAGFTRRGAWIVGLSTGRGFATLDTWASWGGSWAGVWAGDFNGDGKTDVAGLGRDGGWRVGISDGSRFDIQDWGAFGRGSIAVEVGDFNGDGKADVAALTRGGSWVAGVSDGARFDAQVWTRWRGIFGMRDVQVADLNGDGKDDLISLDGSGRLLAALAEDGSFATVAWARSGRRVPAGVRLQVGDLNGDQRDDAAFFLPDGRWFGSITSGLRGRVSDLGVWPLGLDGLPYRGDITPYAAGAPWLASNSRVYVEATPAVTLRNMYFNSPRSYRSFVENFYGVLRTWLHEAERRRLRGNDQLKAFLGGHLDDHFQHARRFLAAAYPGKSEQTYRLLMCMNLVHGYYLYATTYGYGRTLRQMLHLRTGDCNEIGFLLTNLVRAAGVRASALAQIYNYPSTQGPFQASHVVVYAGGLWLDAEINTALAVDLNQIARISPMSRLQHLQDRRRVFGFYDWYLEPNVRGEQLSRGVDGGIIAFYYQFYLAGIAQGNTLLYFIRGV
jgi:hypothetical protein